MNGPIQIPQANNVGMTVGNVERWGSMLGGGALLVYGLSRRSLGGVALALLGGDLIYHGLARDDGPLHRIFGLETPQDRIPAMTIPHGHGFKVQRSVTVHRSPQELYDFWRNLENLPGFFDHLESVQVVDPLHSHWVAQAPAGLKAEWDAEIINDIPGELIAWRSVDGADVPNAGSVHFEQAPRGKASRVRVVLKYDPPAGPIGTAFARLFGDAPSQAIRADMQRFKTLMEQPEATLKAQT